ncbi:hypothetical protein [Shewanella dokdonensis]|uniref:hypothetical protein n=1 Tax=Shewanella dokdonensis TaxID=712036 RepID=UPI001FCF9F26|nr:hypothetical protein [Shewanella dokdonensis]
MNAYASSVTTGAKKTVVDANAGADDKVASVLGQISMGKKLPPEEKLQNAVTKLAQLAGLDEQQLQQLSGQDPKALLQQLAAMLNNSSAVGSAADGTGKSEDNLDSALAQLLDALVALLPQDDTSTAAADSAQTLQALLSQLQQHASGDAAGSDKASDKTGVNSDDESQTDTPLEQALAELLAALQQLPVNQHSPATTTASGKDLLGANGSTHSSPQGQLQQLLAQLLTDEQAQDKAGAGNSATDKSLIAQMSSTGQLLDADAAAKHSALDKFSDSIKAALENVAEASADKAAKSPLIKDLQDSITEVKSPQHAAAPGLTTATNRNGMTQYQLSLRQAGEPQQSTQELVQRFAPAIRQQLLTMVNNGVHHAEIRLDPPNLVR